MHAKWNVEGRTPTDVEMTLTILPNRFGVSGTLPNCNLGDCAALQPIKPLPSMTEPGDSPGSALRMKGLLETRKVAHHLRRNKVPQAVADLAEAILSRCIAKFEFEDVIILRYLVPCRNAPGKGTGAGAEHLLGAPWCCTSSPHGPRSRGGRAPKTRGSRTIST
jgi:hypothetical protein